MAIVADAHPFAVGVDTHARTHVYTILTAATGVVIGSKDFPTTAAGINRAPAWVARGTEADADTLWFIEGAASYGAILTGTVTAHGSPVAEAPRMEAKQRYGIGKSDGLDAHRIATATLPSLQILVTARTAMTQDRTRSINALNAMIRSHDLGLDARGKLSSAQISEVAK